LVDRYCNVANALARPSAVSEAKAIASVMLVFRADQGRAVGIAPEMPVAESEQGSRPIRSRVRQQRSALPDHAYSSSATSPSRAAA